MTNELLLELDKYKKNNNLKKVKELTNKIIILNMEYAKDIAIKFSKQTYFDIEDLESFAYEGLINVVRNYDVNCGVDFYNYANKGILNSIISGIKPKYELPNILTTLFIKAQREVQNNYCRKYIPGDNEMLKDILYLLVTKYNVDERDIDRIYKIEMMQGAYYNTDIEIDDIYEKSNSVLNGMIFSAIRIKLDKKLRKLSPQRQLFIKMRYGFYDKIYSRPEISRELNLSKATVKQTLYRGIKDLKEFNMDELFELYTELDYSNEYGIASDDSYQKVIK